MKRGAFILGVAAFLSLDFEVAAGQLPQPQPEEPTAKVALWPPITPESKLVWAHSMMCFPLDTKVYSQYKPLGYPALYPLHMSEGLPSQSVEIESAKSAGIDGFSVDIFTGNAANYWKSADQVPGFYVAPCLDLSMVPPEKRESETLSAILENCKEAAKHPSAAKIGDAFFFFTYGTNMMPPEGWERVRAAAAAKGFKTYFMVDVDFGGVAARHSLSETEIRPYLSVFDSFYLFGGAGSVWSEALKFFRDANRPFGGGLMPGYFRLGGGNVDPQGTAQYRKAWEQHLKAGLPWICINTWNDLAENSEVMPNSDWNFTRSDLTYWYSKRLKKEPTGWVKPRLYLTSKKAVYVGEKALAEALVLNPTGAPARVTLQLYDGEGRRYGDSAIAKIRTDSEGAAVLSPLLQTFPKGRFLRAKATLWNGKKRAAEVWGAPILILDPSSQPGLEGHLYYSVPADRALAKGQVQLSVSGGVPVGGETALAKVETSSPARFTELLHNTRLIKNLWAKPFVALAVPSPTVPDAGFSTFNANDTEWGFYVGRVTDHQYRVGYSDPVYFAPRGDLTLSEKYDFDEGSESVAKDSSPYHRKGQLNNASWLSPGNKEQGYCLHFDGEKARLDLPLSSTPAGPLSVSIDVRPSRYEGMIFCDSGGFWVQLTGKGNLLLTRLSTTGFIVATGQTIIPKNRWTHLEIQWDGAVEKIYVDGKLDGQATVQQSTFRSGRRALGCNPFGRSSTYYQGDFDNLEIRQLPSSR